MRQYADSTLMKCTKSQLIQMIRSLELTCDGLHEMNDRQFRLLMEKEIYAWHDLRKNPEDLPKPLDEYARYDCVLEHHEHDRYYPSFQYDEDSESFGFWENEFNAETLGFADSVFETMEDLGFEKVIAWRYIEPFEEVEDA